MNASAKLAFRDKYIFVVRSHYIDVVMPRRPRFSSIISSLFEAAGMINHVKYCSCVRGENNIYANRQMGK